MKNEEENPYVKIQLSQKDKVEQTRARKAEVRTMISLMRPLRIQQVSEKYTFIMTIIQFLFFILKVSI